MLRNQEASVARGPFGNDVNTVGNLHKQPRYRRLVINHRSILHGGKKLPQDVIKSHLRTEQAF